MNKEEMIQQLERDKEQVTDPTLKKEIENKIDHIKQGKWITK